KIENGQNAEVAVDQYHRYKEDVQHLKYMGMDTYRFSISWPRIFPKGSPRHGGVNEEGIAYYNNLINELIKNGIEPFVTLYHWDLPQALEDEYGGFLSSKVVEDVAVFAEKCFEEFGDRVKYWISINEPVIFSSYGYDKGLHAPGRCSPSFGNCTAGNSATEPYIVAHNLLLAHSAVAKTYRTKYQVKQKGSIGIALVVNWFVPFTKSIENQKAAQRAIDFNIGWFLDPLTKGEYPESMRSLVGARLPRFTSQQSKDLKGSFDFLGYNYYTTRFAINNANPINPHNTSYSLDVRANLTSTVNGVSIGEEEGVNIFRSYPVGLWEVLKYTKYNYKNPTIYITETGYGDYDNGTALLKQTLNDEERLKYHLEHLSYVHKAIREGLDIRGYIVWEFIDNFEWASGYDSRFGLYYVDYKNNLKRYARASADWFKHILTT
ncbi:hypothetical protein KI387_000387, partial [Taxus chinensis]